jgi:hypothetical protein
MSADRDGFALTPDVVLFIGAAVLTLAVIVGLGIFLARALRAERRAEAERRGGGA